jgi:hypothetical protein
MNNLHNYRDYIAAEAMKVLLEAVCMDFDQSLTVIQNMRSKRKLNLGVIAKKAYLLADAMIMEGSQNTSMCENNSIINS